METYKCLHIPTGKLLEREWEEHGQDAKFWSHHFKLTKLNEWNAQQAGIWQYWM